MLVFRKIWRAFIRPSALLQMISLFEELTGSLFWNALLWPNLQDNDNKIMIKFNQETNITNKTVKINNENLVA